MGVLPSPSRSAIARADFFEELLERFRPALYFVDDVGPGGSRTDYPCSFLDDSDIENNFAGLATPQPSLCYGSVHEQRDANGKLCLVVEYDYYYPRNWSELPPPAGCFTHEHDWEWIYVVVGLDGADYRPYCASFSGHTAGNPELFDMNGKVRLFPGIAGGSVWRTEWDRHPEWAPRVSLGWDEHVEATALASGNAFDGSPTQPRSPSYWTHYEVRGRETVASSCSQTARFCYGDPELSPFCIGRSGLGECDDPRDPPWIRQGLGAQDPLPAGFALPDDWEENPSTETGTESPGARNVRVGPNPCRGRLEIVIPGGSPPGVDRGARCRGPPCPPPLWRDALWRRDRRFIRSSKSLIGSLLPSGPLAGERGGGASCGSIALMPPPVAAGKHAGEAGGGGESALLIGRIRAPPVRCCSTPHRRSGPCNVPFRRRSRGGMERAHEECAHDECGHGRRGRNHRSRRRPRCGSDRGAHRSGGCVHGGGSRSSGDCAADPAGRLRCTGLPSGARA